MKTAQEVVEYLYDWFNNLITPKVSIKDGEVTIDNESITVDGDVSIEGAVTVNGVVGIDQATANANEVVVKPNKDNPLYIRIADTYNPNLDAFGRVRISNPTSVFDSQLQYDAQPLIWQSVLTGTGTATHLPNESSVRMRCSTSSGDKVIRQTKRYFKYQSGKSCLVEMTGVMGAKKANVRQRIGQFDTNNGLFFEQDSSNLKVVRRTYASATPIDTAINQSDWNIDKLDGTGTSGITLNMSKTHIFVIDYQWLGVGRIRFGFVIDGDLVYCHTIMNANILTEVYMTTANLPLRYEIENTGETASITDMKQICSAVMSEGGYEEEYGITRTASNGITPIACTSRRPILTIRPKATFNSITNRGTVLPLSIDLHVATNSAYYEIVVNGSLTGASYASLGTNSISEFDVASTAISGGEVIGSGYVSASASTRNQLTELIKSKLVLVNDYAGTTPDTLSIVITSMSGTSNVASSLDVKELY